MIDIDIDHFRARVLQDCLTEATASYWIHRAYQFQEAAPRKGDDHGFAEYDELIDAYQRCMGIALACRRRAQLIMDGMPEEICREVQDTIDQMT
jgi:hypothetical protein